MRHHGLAGRHHHNCRGHLLGGILSCQQCHRQQLHITRVQSKKRHNPQPDDERKRMLDDELQLKPPRLRPPNRYLTNDQVLDWRSYRAKLVLMDHSGLLEPGCSSPVPFAFNSSIWAHELPAPEMGCILVARQEGMDIFDRSVVLLAAHDPLHGSVGFILNKPSALRMCEVQLSATARGLLCSFGSQHIQLAGPVQMETLTLLHAFGGLAGAQKVSEGVYYGGLPAAVELVRTGLAQPEDFRLMLGMSGWSAGQLEEEIASGAWYVVSAGQGVVLPPIDGPLNSGPPDAMWRRVLELIGKLDRV